MRRPTPKLESTIGNAVDGPARVRTPIGDQLASSRVGRRAGAPVLTEAEGIVDLVRPTPAVQYEEHDAGLAVDSLPLSSADHNQLDQGVPHLLADAIDSRGAEPQGLAIDAGRDGDGWVGNAEESGLRTDPIPAHRPPQVIRRPRSAGDYAGTGIGSALCNRLVKRPTGGGWNEAALGVGSTSSFTIPAVETERSQTDRAGPSSGGDADQ